MKELLSLKELGEVHGVPEQAMKKYFKADAKKPPGRRYLPDPDFVIGGGRLRGRVPGLELIEESDDESKNNRSDARYGWLPATGLAWQRPGQGARRDLAQPGEPAPAYIVEQIAAAVQVVQATYAVSELLMSEPIGDDKAHRRWNSRYEAAVATREAARGAFADTFGDQAPIPTPQQVLHQQHRHAD
ncbi:hypothetical protein AB0N05_37800 [Nocardia sp. NPDC051030]|uniref:hypothetical protein n=1 Tax=Nocardia sp. NPDC051030 TaxID=3155162 RepID=UPI00344A1CF6